MGMYGQRWHRHKEMRNRGGKYRRAIPTRHELLGFPRNWMDKKTFVDHLAETAGLTKKGAHDAVEAFRETLVVGLREDGEVVLGGIGKFYVEERPAHVGRNPATGEAIDIPAKNRIRFKPGKALKDEVE